MVFFFFCFWTEGTRPGRHELPGQGSGRGLHPWIGQSFAGCACLLALARGFPSSRFALDSPFAKVASPPGVGRAPRGASLIPSLTSLGAATFQNGLAALPGWAGGQLWEREFSLADPVYGAEQSSRPQAPRGPLERS